MSEQKTEQEKKLSPDEEMRQKAVEEAKKIDQFLSGDKLDAVVSWLVKKKKISREESEKKRKANRLKKIQEQKEKLAEEERKLKEAESV